MVNGRRNENLDQIPGRIALTHTKDGGRERLSEDSPADSHVETKDRPATHLEIWRSDEI